MKYSMLYPSRLWVPYKGTVRFFDTPMEASDWINSLWVMGRKAWGWSFVVFFLALVEQLRILPIGVGWDGGPRLSHIASDYADSATQPGLHLKALKLSPVGNTHLLEDWGIAYPPNGGSDRYPSQRHGAIKAQKRSFRLNGLQKVLYVFSLVWFWTFWGSRSRIWTSFGLATSLVYMFWFYTRQQGVTGDLFLWHVQRFILDPWLQFSTGSHTTLMDFLVTFIHNADTLYNVYYVEIR